MRISLSLILLQTFLAFQAAASFPDSVMFHGKKWKLEPPVKDTIYLSHETERLPLRYFSKEDTTLYSTGGYFLNSYVEFLDLRRCGQIASDTTRIRHRTPEIVTHLDIQHFNMRQCIIDSMFDTHEDIEEYSDVLGRECHRQRHCRLSGNLIIQSTTFLHSVDLENDVVNGNILMARLTVIGSLRFRGAEFKLTEGSGIIFTQLLVQGDADFTDATIKAFEFSHDTILGTTTFYRTKFNGFPPSFRESVFRGGFVISDVEFKSVDFMGVKFAGGLSWANVAFEQDARFEDAMFISQARFSNVIFRNSADFDGAWFLVGVTLEGVSFNRHASFSNLIFLSASDNDLWYLKENEGGRLNDSNPMKIVRGKVGFLERAYFAEYCLLRVDGDIARLGIGLEDWNRVWVDVVDISNSTKPDADYINGKRLLNSVVKYVNDQQTAPKDLRDEALSRLNYQLVQLDRRYSQSTIEKLWLGFLELVVRNGYHGGGNFAIVVSVLVVVFAFGYCLHHQNELDAFIKQGKFISEGGDQEAHAPESRPVRKEPFLRTIRSLWFSIYIFITPKFDKQYFKFSGGLQRLVITEWMIGLGMIGIYLVYIATKFAFVKALLGI